jgi:AcrR family transcriptional regulator
MRVTDQYRESRRAEIMGTAARLFAANGFHATSMADIIGGSGLSAGAVYRYFRSKEELIASVAEAALSSADETFEGLLADGTTPSPEETVTAVIRTITERVAPDPVLGVDVTKISVQVWSEALRSPHLATRADDVYRRLRGHFAEVARRWQAAGNLPADTDPDQVGAAMLGLVQGFVVQRLLVSDTEAENYLSGVRALLSVSAARAQR